MRTTSTSQEDRSSQKENTVGDIFKNSYLFQTQQAEILGLDFKILALFLFLICLGQKIKHKNVFSLRSLDLQILTAKKETCPVFFFFLLFLFFFFKGKGTVHRIRHFRIDQSPQYLCLGKVVAFWSAKFQHLFKIPNINHILVYGQINGKFTIKQEITSQY